MGSKKEKPAKVDWVCRKCGSHNVTRDAEAAWDVTKQEWELLTVYDNFTCQACGDTGNLVADTEEVPAEAGPEPAPAKEG